MNQLEQQMITVLKDLRENHGAVGVRAEFEAEGTRLEELLRLKDISMAAGLGLTLKIGGCESVRDLLEAQIIGVDCLVAPMIESAYALRKYLQAIQKVIAVEEKESIKYQCNIESITAFNELDEILEIPEISLLDGIVIEKVDLCFSMGLTEHDINIDEINDLVRKILEKAKAKGLLCTIGGGVGVDSIPFFLSLPEGRLDYYETRKVSFDCARGLANSPKKGMLKALGFELLWLRNKMNFYKGVSLLDEQRIDIIEQRYRYEIDSLLTQIV